MRVLDLKIENLLSIENVSMSFDDTGLVLVEGWNYDTQRANGAGKTAIFNCLSFALYDKLPRKITASEIVRRGVKSGYASCSVQVGEDIWMVKRCRPKAVEFYKNDIKQDITQEEFESFIRLTYDQFLLTIYIPQANSGKSVRFLNSPDSDKKEFILQLLNLNAFSEAKASVDINIKAIQAAIDLTSNKLQTSRSRIEAYEESLVDVDSINAANDKIMLSITSIEKEILELSSVEKPDVSKFLEKEREFQSKISDLGKVAALRYHWENMYRKAQAQIQDYDSDRACGECGSSLDTQEAKDKHAEHQKNLLKDIADIKLELDACDDAKAKAKPLLDMQNKIYLKRNATTEAYQAAQVRIAELKPMVKLKNSQIENNTLKLNNNQELINKINELQKNIESYQVDISNNKKHLELYKVLSAVYSPTGAQAYVLDSVVDSFNEVIQKYIDIMSPNISYQLNSFKETAKGDMVAKFSETLIKDGDEISVGSLSGGEEKGLSLCVDFALLEVLETQFGMSLNPIILDEPFDGLDAAGREIVINLLETLARDRQIFVVDHASEAKALFTKSIKVELKNKVSTISSEF